MFGGRDGTQEHPCLLRRYAFRTPPVSYDRATGQSKGLTDVAPYNEQDKRAMAFLIEHSAELDPVATYRELQLMMFGAQIAPMPTCVWRFMTLGDLNFAMTVRELLDEQRDHFSVPVVLEICKRGGFSLVKSMLERDPTLLNRRYPQSEADERLRGQNMLEAAVACRNLNALRSILAVRQTDRDIQAILLGQLHIMQEIPSSNNNDRAIIECLILAAYSWGIAIERIPQQGDYAKAKHTALSELHDAYRDISTNLGIIQSVIDAMQTSASPDEIRKILTSSTPGVFGLKEDAKVTFLRKQFAQQIRFAQVYLADLRKLFGDHHAKNPVVLAAVLDVVHYDGMGERRVMVCNFAHQIIIDMINSVLPEGGRIQYNVVEPTAAEGPVPVVQPVPSAVGQGMHIDDAVTPLVSADLAQSTVAVADPAEKGEKLGDESHQEEDLGIVDQQPDAAATPPVPIVQIASDTTTVITAVLDGAALESGVPKPPALPADSASDANKSLKERVKERREKAAQGGSSLEIERKKPLYLLYDLMAHPHFKSLRDAASDDSDKHDNKWPEEKATQEISDITTSALGSSQFAEKPRDDDWSSDDDEKRSANTLTKNPL
jgi:hypothetical protein